MPAGAMAQKRAEADSAFHRYGITFAVYGDGGANGDNGGDNGGDNDGGTERLIPFDVIPRIIPAAEWSRMPSWAGRRLKKF